MRTTDDKPNIPRLITVEALSRSWGLRAGTIREWARRGTLPSLRIGAKVFIPVEGLSAVVAEAKRQAAASGRRTV